jgi:hypothetical protein
MNELTPDQHRILVGAIHDSATVVHKGRMMNERIKLLAEQAGSTHKQNLGVYQFYTDELVKFAELIVRECALTAGLMEHEGRPNIGAQILDNFGVES